MYPLAVADLLTSPEVAEMLGIPLRQVQRMAKTGRLPVAQKLPGGKHYLFSREVVELIQGKGEEQNEPQDRGVRHL